MKAISLSTNKSTVMLAGIGAALVLYFYWEAKAGVKNAVGAVGSVAKPVVNAMNPASQTNVVQKIGTAVVRLTDPKAVTQDTTLSTKIVDWFNFGRVNDYDPNASAAPTMKQPGTR